MSSVEFAHPYVAVSGDIGVGKSTAGRLIARRLGYTYYPEPRWEKNPFLKEKGKEFAAETHFLMESIAVLLLARAQRELGGVVVDVPREQHVNDYPRFKLDERQLETFLKMSESLEQSYDGILMTPSLIVYLEAHASVILDRIHKRGRDFEQGITVDDIEKHTKFNHDWIAASKIPVVFINTDHLDVVHSEPARRYLVGQVRDKLNSHA